MVFFSSVCVCVWLVFIPLFHEVNKNEPHKSGPTPTPTKCQMFFIHSLIDSIVRMKKKRSIFVSFLGIFTSNYFFFFISHVFLRVTNKRINTVNTGERNEKYQNILLKIFICQNYLKSKKNITKGFVISGIKVCN